MKIPVKVEWQWDTVPRHQEPGRRIGTFHVSRNGTPLQIVVGRLGNQDPIYYIEPEWYERDFPKIPFKTDLRAAHRYVKNHFIPAGAGEAAA